MDEEDDLYNNALEDSNGDVEMYHKDSIEDLQRQSTDNCAEACWLLTTTQSGNFHVRHFQCLFLFDLVACADISLSLKKKKRSDTCPR